MFTYDTLPQKTVKPAALSDNIQKKRTAANSLLNSAGKQISRRKSENNTGLPDALKARIENISGIGLDDVKVHFLPYTMLRFRSRLKRKQKITEKELTEYLEEVILILEEEVSAGGLTELQYHDYVRLIRHAAERVFAKHRKLFEEVDRMTKPLIKLPSVEIRELKEELAEKEAENAKQKEEYVKQKAEIAKQKAENAKQKAEIQRLQEMLRLAGNN